MIPSNIFDKGFDHNLFLAAFESINHQALERCKREGKLDPTLIAIKDGKHSEMYFENSIEYRFLLAVRSYFDNEQPDAFIAIHEAWTHIDGTVYGEYHPDKEEFVLILARSKDGVIKENRMYKTIRGENGHILRFEQITGNDEDCAIPAWGERRSVERKDV